ncbi:MAG: hypothetical protein WBP02_16765 [Gammaproteobacteria bacterium]
MCIKLRESLVGLVLMIGALQGHAATVAHIEIESSENGESKGTQTQIVTIDEKKVRLDYLGAESEKTANTPYLLTLNAGKKWILGDQRDGQFYCAKVDMKDFFRDIGKIVSRIDTLARPKFSDMKVELLVEEPGPDILGYATTHLRIQTTAKVKASVLMKKFEYGMNKVDDIWYTKEREVHPAKQRWIEALTHSGYEQLDQLSSGLRSKIGGPILIHNSAMETTNYKENKVETYGRKVRVVSIKELKSSEVAEGTFTKPDCKEINKGQTKDAAKSMFKEGKLTL